MKAYSQKYPGLRMQWSNDSLVFDGSLKNQWSILRLLDEAGFTGELSALSRLSQLDPSSHATRYDDGYCLVGGRGPRPPFGAMSRARWVCHP